MLGVLRKYISAAVSAKNTFFGETDETIQNGNEIRGNHARQRQSGAARMTSF